MRPLLPVLPLCAAVLVMAAPPALRAEEPAAPSQPTPQEQTLQGLDLILQGLKRMIEQVPLYGPPELAPNGDIILRRLSPGEPPPAPPPPADAPGGTRL